MSQQLYDPRGWADGRYAPPPPHFEKRSKLTGLDRQEIGYLRHEGVRSIDLAVLYNVSRATIDGIAKVERPYV